MAREYAAIAILLSNMESRIMTKIEQLTADVAAYKTVEESAVALIQGLAQQIKDLKGQGGATDAQLDELIANIEGQSAGLAQAITDNTTPPTPTPAPAPEPAPAPVDVATPPAADPVVPGPIPAPTTSPTTDTPPNPNTPPS
jgi:hypothetical protein